MSELVILLLVVVGLVAAGFGVWAFLRFRYRESLRAKGWQFVDSPDISVAYGLNQPPFGVGFGRRVDDQIVGRAGDGTPFSAFRYTCSEWRSRGYVVRMPLGRSLAPTAAPSPDGHAPISVDHDSIVLTDSPLDADELATAVEALAAARSVLLASPAAALEGPPPPVGLSFAGRPHWTYIARNDDHLRLVNHTGGGFNHEAHDIVFSENDGIAFIRLTHRWQTRHTRTDSEGRTHTEVRNHVEHLCDFRAAFPFRSISVNWGLLGPRRRFEWEAFNQRFAVRCADARFASDVVHQQQMDYLMRSNPPPFLVEPDGRIRIGEGNDWTPEEIAWVSDFLFGFFGHVPGFVWRQLGAWPPPVPQLEA